MRQRTILPLIISLYAAVLAGLMLLNAAWFSTFFRTLQTLLILGFFPLLIFSILSMLQRDVKHLRHEARHSRNAADSAASPHAARTCESCGYNMAGVPGDVCPECGCVSRHVHTPSDGVRS